MIGFLTGGGGFSPSASSSATGGTAGTGPVGNTVTYNAGLSLSNPLHLAAIAAAVVGVVWLMRKK